MGSSFWDQVWWCVRRPDRSSWTKWQQWTFKTKGFRQHALIFGTSVELADDTTALLIYWQMWWHGPVPRLYPFDDFLHTDSANRHILGCGDPSAGPVIPKFELGRHVCTMLLTANFHHPHLIVPKLSCWQTNRRRWKHPPRSAMLRRWVTNFRVKDRRTRSTALWTLTGFRQVRQNKIPWLFEITLKYFQAFRGAFYNSNWKCWLHETSLLA